jgi:hypothetical protein
MIVYTLVIYNNFFKVYYARVSFLAFISSSLELDWDVLLSSTVYARVSFLAFMSSSLELDWDVLLDIGLLGARELAVLNLFSPFPNPCTFSRGRCLVPPITSSPSV